MRYRTRQVFSWLLLISTIVVGFLLGLGIFHPPSAAALIIKIEESPNQIVYQSRHNLKDQHGYT